MICRSEICTGAAYFVPPRLAAAGTAYREEGPMAGYAKIPVGRLYEGYTTPDRPKCLGGEGALRLSGSADVGGVPSDSDAPWGVRARE